MSESFIEKRPTYQAIGNRVGRSTVKLGENCFREIVELAVGGGTVRALAVEPSDTYGRPGENAAYCQENAGGGSTSEECTE
jgi:hypothetical protein